MSGIWSKVRAVLTIATDLLLVGRKAGWWNKGPKPPGLEK